MFGTTKLRRARNILSVSAFISFADSFTEGHFLTENEVDVATRLISLDDDPTLPAMTFRTWVLGLGLSCFGAVLGQIFVCSLAYSFNALNNLLIIW